MRPETEEILHICQKDATNRNDDASSGPAAGCHFPHSIGKVVKERVREERMKVIAGELWVDKLLQTK